MERLTIRNERGGIDCQDVKAALEKLAAYEDTSYSPDDIRVVVKFRAEVRRLCNLYQENENQVVTVEIPAGWSVTGPAWWVLCNFVTGNDIRAENDVSRMHGIVLSADNGEKYGVIRVDPKAKTITAEPARDERKI